MNLSGTWTGAPSRVTFKLVQRVNKVNTEIYSGFALNASITLSANSNDANCYSSLSVKKIS